MVVEQVLVPMLWGWLGAATLMVVLWLWQMRSGNAGIVDVGWAFALGLAAIVYARFADGEPMRRAEVGILGVHRIKERPVVRDGEVVVGQVMLLSLSFDHRIIDGADGAKFLSWIIEAIQEPLLLSLARRERRLAAVLHPRRAA